MFLARLQPHVCTCPSFSPVQSAYRRNYSTETALLHTLDQIYCSSDQGKPTLLVSLDLSAAFDTIDHITLLNRLNTSFGVSDVALAWLKSYLIDRYQSVRAGQSTSPYTHCPTGVPQGSVLGPLLFSCYVSPVSSIASSLGVSVQQYADDTEIYIALSAVDLTAHLNTLSNCLSALHNWFCHNGLSLNSTKSESILIGTRQRLCNLPPVAEISFAGSTIPFSNTITTLGVTLDSNLSLNQHIQSLNSNLHYHIRALRHIRPIISDSVAATLGSSLVQSRLDYTNSLLYGTSASNIHKLQCAQNSLTRIVSPYHHGLSSTDRLISLHWLPVRHRITFKIATLTYKVLNNQQPPYLHCLLQPYQPSRTLRSSNQQLLQLPTVRTDFSRRAFSYAAPKIWNNLPIHIRNCPSLNTFKKHLKTHLFTQIASHTI